MVTSFCVFLFLLVIFYLEGLTDCVGILYIWVLVRWGIMAGGLLVGRFLSFKGIRSSSSW